MDDMKQDDFFGVVAKCIADKDAPIMAKMEVLQTAIAFAWEQGYIDYLQSLSVVKSLRELADKIEND